MTESTSARPRLILVDGSGYLFRAFHAMRELTRADGTPVNAVYGFCSMLWKLYQQEDSDGLAVIFDAGAKSFRNDIYPAYKAHRPPPPEALIPQFPLVRDATRAFGLPSIELAGYEADDLIATFAEQASNSGWDVDIVSSDKDLMQLVGPHVRMLGPRDLEPIGPPEVAEKFGVPPERVVDVQALAGDATDNVPGVPGIGVKTAAELVSRFGSLEDVLAGAPAVKQPKRRERLLEHADDARISMRLVTLKRDVPVDVGVEDMRRSPPDPDLLLGFLRAQGFASLVQRIAGQLDGAGTAAASTEAAPVERDYELVTDLRRLDAWVALANAAGIVAVDTETTGLELETLELVGISLATAPGRACYIPLAHVGAADSPGEDGLFTPPAPAQAPKDQVLARLRSLLEDPAILKIGQNIKYDANVLHRAAGIEVTPIDDTMLLSYVVDAGRAKHGLDSLSERHLGIEPIPFSAVCGSGRNQILFSQVPLDKACEYAAEDADLTLQLHQCLRPRVLKERMVTVYETLERPLVPVLAAMERAGIAVDRGTLEELRSDFEARMAALETRIHGLAGRAFNLSSPAQLGTILFEELGLTPGGKTRVKKSASTSHAVLEELAGQGHEIASSMIAWRQVQKLLSTYIEALLERSRATGRVHTSYHMTGAATGRLSSSDPNLQNIPIRTEEGRRIRRAFVAPPGRVLLAADYSQIELRLLAEVAGIEPLREAFRDGADIHTLTAASVFAVAVSEVDAEMRRRAKTVNFGLIYGQSAFGLARQLGIPKGEAQGIIDAYFKQYPGIERYMETTKQFARDHGYIETMFGRRCHLPNIRARNFSARAGSERAAINAPLQGAAADIIKRAMIRMPDALRGAGLQADMLLQVHDELVFEVPEAEVEATSAVVKRTMETAPLPACAMSVPLVVDVGVAANWEAAH
ncbi:MAG: DNA polymerase I [Rhodospirillales bacterium]|nr:DNA polymerase I [Rhodospirillales bacterium]